MLCFSCINPMGHTLLSKHRLWPATAMISAVWGICYWEISCCTGWRLLCLSSLNYWSVELMESSWATEKSQKWALSLWRHLLWKLWIYITCPMTSVHVKQGFTVRCCLQSWGHFALECFLGKETQTHAVSHKVISSNMLSGPFCSCLATREGGRRRMWEHGGIWRSRSSVANQSANIISKTLLSVANQLLALLSYSIATGHSYWPSSDGCLPKVRTMILL